jgi:hypothetical protein
MFHLTIMYVSCNKYGVPYNKYISVVNSYIRYIKLNLYLFKFNLTYLLEREDILEEKVIPEATTLKDLALGQVEDFLVPHISGQEIN